MLTQPVDIVPAISSLGGTEEERRWFAVFTRSHHEKRVAQYYAERDIEHLLPVSRVERQWSHYRKVTIEMPLFPNYLFVHISRRERTRAIEVPGALSLVGQNSVPAPLPDVEIESLRESLKLHELRATSLPGCGVQGSHQKRRPCRQSGGCFAQQKPLPGGTYDCLHHAQLSCRGGRRRP